MSGASNRANEVLDRKAAMSRADFRRENDVFVVGSVFLPPPWFHYTWYIRLNWVREFERLTWRVPGTSSNVIVLVGVLVGSIGFPFRSASHYKF